MSKNHSSKSRDRKACAEKYSSHHNLSNSFHEISSIMCNNLLYLVFFLNAKKTIGRTSGVCLFACLFVFAFLAFQQHGKKINKRVKWEPTKVYLTFIKGCNGKINPGIQNKVDTTADPAATILSFSRGQWGPTSRLALAQTLTLIWCRRSFCSSVAFNG